VGIGRIEAYTVSFVDRGAFNGSGGRYLVTRNVRSRNPFMVSAAIINTSALYSDDSRNISALAGSS